MNIINIIHNHKLLIYFSGIAVEVTSTISRLPQINDNILPRGHLLLQNLASIICSKILDPKPYEIILDMCAAPGNKTTHIAQLMNNTVNFVFIILTLIKLISIIYKINNI